jgi:hypothetical protein
MKVYARSITIPLAVTALTIVAVGGCGKRSYGRGLRRLAPYGVRVGQVDFRDSKLIEVEDRSLVGLYLRTSVKGRTLIELAVDAAFDDDAPDEKLLYSAGVSVLYFPIPRGGVYLHAGGGAMSEATGLNDYIDGYASAGAGCSIPLGATRLDVRATMWQMINSANITRAYVLTIGYGF